MQTTTAPTTTAMRASLAQRRDQDDNETIIDLALELMQSGAECDPYQDENFTEALTQASGTEREKVAALMRLGQIADAGAAQHGIVLAYWARHALSKGRCEYDIQMETACHYCQDKGCPHCESDYFG